MLLRNGHLVDPSQAIDGVTDIRIENGVVSEVGPDLPEQDGEEITYSTQKTLIPMLFVQKQ